MILNVILTILVVYIFISLLLLPIQFRLLVALKKEEEKNKMKGKTQGEMYDEMNAGELALSENPKGNPLFLLANILASFMYRSKFKRK